MLKPMFTFMDLPVKLWLLQILNKTNISRVKEKVECMSFAFQVTKAVGGSKMEGENGGTDALLPGGENHTDYAMIFLQQEIKLTHIPYLS